MFDSKNILKNPLKSRPILYVPDCQILKLIIPKFEMGVEKWSFPHTAKRVHRFV